MLSIYSPVQSINQTSHVNLLNWKSINLAGEGAREKKANEKQVNKKLKNVDSLAGVRLIKHVSVFNETFD